METKIVFEKGAKKKKGGQRSWWFFPKSKRSVPGTYDETPPQHIDRSSSSVKFVNGSEKNHKSVAFRNGCGNIINNGCHGNNSHLKIEEVSLKQNKDPTDLETRLDMETFTNNLWIEFENELKVVWPHNRSNSHPPSTLAASNEVVKTSATAYNNLDVVNTSQHCCDTNDKDEAAKEVVNHVVEGKPPLPPLPSAQRNRSKVIGMSKIVEKTSVDKNKEEVNDPCMMFDKLRQIAKEGRDRVAKSVQDLNKLEENIQISDENASNVHRINERQSPTTSKVSNKRCKSNQSLVGYLETDIDTFHSREVILVNPGNYDNSNSFSCNSRPNAGSVLAFGSNVKRYRPVKLKTQSLFNLIDSHNNAKENVEPLTAELDIDDDVMTPSCSSRAKSMEFLLKAENKAAVEAPENRLMRLRTNIYHNNEEIGYKTPESSSVKNRVISEHEERIRRSLQKLNLPEWCKNAWLNHENLRRDTDERRTIRWENYRNSSSNVYSGSSLNKPGNAVVVGKRVMAPDWRHFRLSRESLVQSPSSQISSSQLDTADDGTGHIYSNCGLSRWSSDRLSINSSRSCSPTSGFNTSGVNRSSIKRQPYLGWRSSEKLAALEKSDDSKPSDTTFYRSAAERLSKGPGYYALRFGVYSSHNSYGGDKDISFV